MCFPKRRKNMFRLFCKHETNDQISERLLKLCEEGDYGICPPPMKASVAINELCNFFLGRDWYSSFPEANKPSISEIVHEIEKRHTLKFLRKRLSASKSITILALPDSMTAQAAINELCSFFLGEGWYMALPVGVEQVNTEIIYQIEAHYK